MKKPVITSFFIVLLLGNVAFAATVHEISISGLSIPSGVEAFNIAYSVSDFSLDGVSTNTFGSAIPGIPSDGIVGWMVDAEKVSSTSYELQLSNFDGLALNIQNPMLNGIIASFTYNGTINEVISFQFGDFNGNEIESVALADLTQANTAFVDTAAVPIPGSILLLGSGLAGLIGIARRKRN